MAENTIDEILKFDPVSSEKKETDNTLDEILKFDPYKSNEEKAVEEIQVKKQEAMSWNEAMISGVKNLPDSMLEYGKTLFHAITHPVETGKAMGYIGEGLAQTLNLKDPSAPYDITNDVDGGYEKLKPLIDEYKNRYGTVEGFKKAIANDPAGVLADISSLIVPAGEISGVSKIAKTGAMLEPFNIVKNAALLPFKLIPEELPIKMYQSAVKFGTTLSQKERNIVTKTALKTSNQIMPTANGMEKLQKKINDYNDKITKLINESSSRGVQLNVDRLWHGIEDLKNQFKMSSDEPKKWDKAFKNMKKEWDEAVSIGQHRTPEQIQKLKQKIYKDLESFYEKQKASPAKVELRKAVARNAREMLEEIIPEIKQLNKEEGALIDLWSAVESKANRITNRDFIGIGLPVKMGTGAGIGHMVFGEKGAAAGTAIGFMLGVYDTPQVKSKLALVMNKLRERGIEVSMTPTIARLVGYQAEKTMDQE